MDQSRPSHAASVEPLLLAEDGASERIEARGKNMRSWEEATLVQEGVYHALIATLHTEARGQKCENGVLTVCWDQPT